MDPISIAATVLAIYAILQRSPSLAGEPVRELGHAWRGEESPAAVELRQRLVDAGIDPATGGPIRQYLGNVWRDYWRGREEERQAERDRKAIDAEVEAAKTWRERVADRLDEEARRRVDRWRTRPEGQRDPQDADVPTFGPVPNADSTPPPVDADGGDGWESSVIHDSDEYDLPPAPPPSGPTPPPSQDREPIRVHATQGDPIRPPKPAPTATAEITAGGTMSTVAQQNVTGVVSGAAEARAIQREVDNATADYVGRLAKVRSRIHALGESTLGNVQMSARSRVVGYTATAAESAAAAQATARACGGEVSPLMGQVAREFNRINS